jgi:hypothetical protein
MALYNEKLHPQEIAKSNMIYINEEEIMKTIMGFSMTSV